MHYLFFFFAVLHQSTKSEGNKFTESCMIWNAHYSISLNVGSMKKIADIVMCFRSIKLKKGKIFFEESNTINKFINFFF